MRRIPAVTAVTGSIHFPRNPVPLPGARRRAPASRHPSPSASPCPSPHALSLPPPWGAARPWKRSSRNPSEMGTFAPRARAGSLPPRPAFAVGGPTGRAGICHPRGARRPTRYVRFRGGSSHFHGRKHIPPSSCWVHPSGTVGVRAETFHPRRRRPTSVDESRERGERGGFFRSFSTQVCVHRVLGCLFQVVLAAWGERAGRVKETRMGRSGVWRSHGKPRTAESK